MKKKKQKLSLNKETLVKMNIVKDVKTKINSYWCGDGSQTCD